MKHPSASLLFVAGWLMCTHSAAWADQRLTYVGPPVDTANAGERRHLIKASRVEIEFKIPLLPNTKYRFSSKDSKIPTAPVSFKFSNGMNTSDDGGYEIALETDSSGQPASWSMRADILGSEIFKSTAPGDPGCETSDKVNGWYRYKKKYPNTPPATAQEDIERKNNEDFGTYFKYQVTGCGPAKWTSDPPFEDLALAANAASRTAPNEGLSWLENGQLPRAPGLNGRQLERLQQMATSRGLPLVQPYILASEADGGLDDLQRLDLAARHLDNINSYPRKIMSPLAEVSGFYDVMTFLEGFASSIAEIRRETTKFAREKSAAAKDDIELWSRVRRARPVIIGQMIEAANGSEPSIQRLSRLGKQILENQFLKSAYSHALIVGTPKRIIAVARDKRIEVFAKAPWDLEALSDIFEAPTLNDGRDASAKWMARKAREYPALLQSVGATGTAEKADTSEPDGSSRRCLRSRPIHAEPKVWRDMYGNLVTEPGAQIGEECLVWSR